MKEGKKMNQKPEFVLAAYATYKELYDSKKYKNPYQILSEFVKYSVCTEKIYFFSGSEIQKQMLEIFGFDVPYAVVKTTLKNTSGIVSNGQDNYTANLDLIKNDIDFEPHKNEAEIQSNKLVKKLIAFVETREGHQLSVHEREKLAECFMAYLLDESNGFEYQESISMFILSSEDDPLLKEQLRDIRAGCILYTGITYGISEIGSITEPLTLFLDMEILFDLFGYNGEMYKTLSYDMLRLIKEANSKKKMINLRYFRDTKYEIEEFFRKAELIVDGKEPLKANMAMEEIVNGCENGSDVLDKETDFFHKLQYEYGILEDNKTDYYSSKLYEYNLEESSSEDPDLQESLKFISHINKLRGSDVATDYLKSKYIFITETNRTIEKAAEIAKRKDASIGNTYARHAIRMNHITNILWYKMNKGFGNTIFPTNIDAVIKARVVLSGYISQKIGYTYEKCKDDYENHIITEEQFAARLVSLKNKKSKPEDISVDTLEDDLNFNEEYIRRYEEEYNLQKVQLKEKNTALERKDLELAEKEKELINSRDTIKLQNEELEMYRKRDVEKQKKEETKKIRNSLIKAIGLRLLVCICVLIISTFVATYIEKMNGSVFVTTVTLVGFVIAMYDFIKRGFLVELNHLIDLRKGKSYIKK